MAILTIAAAAFSLFRSGSKSLWMDEALSINVTSSWGELWLRLQEMRGGSWLYYLLLMPWRLFAESEWALRSFSALFAVGAVVTVYFLGREFGNRPGGLLAGILLASHPLFIEHAQYIRVYAMLLFLVSINALVILYAVRFGTWTLWILSAALGVLSFAAHYFAILAFGAQFFCACALWYRQVAWKRAAVCFAIYSTGILIQILVFKAFAATGALSFIPVPRMLEIESMLAAFSGGGQKYQLLFFTLAVAACVSWLARALMGPGDLYVRTRPMLFTLGWFVAPIAGMFVFSYLVTPSFLPRYVIAALPAGALIVGLSVQSFRPEWIRTSIALAVIFVQLLGARELYNRHEMEDWRSAGNYFHSNATPGSTVLIFRYYAEAPFLYYAGLAPRHRPGTPWGLEGTDWAYLASDVANSPVPFSQIPEKLAPMNSLWLVLAHDNLPLADGTATRDRLQAMLKEFHVADERQFRQVKVIHYERTR